MIFILLCTCDIISSIKIQEGAKSMKATKKILAIMLVLAIAVSVFASFGAVSASGGEIYVSTTGSDSADGTRENPVATLKKACELAGEGATIIISASRFSLNGRI